LAQERVLAALGVLALVAIIGGGLALALGGDDEPSVRTAGATSTTAVFVPTSTTLPDTSTTIPPDQTSVTVGIVCTTPEDASGTLVATWAADDRAAAALCASQAAVDTIFQTSGAGAQWTFQGCVESSPGVPACAFTYPGGIAYFTLTGSEAQGWTVDAVEFVAA
jgi:hypothetical protein